MGLRNEYEKSVRFNGLDLSEVIIDQHYKENHSEMSDELILGLVDQLHDTVSPVLEKKMASSFSLYNHYCMTMRHIE